jgi:hypothetical protein
MMFQSSVRSGIFPDVAPDGADIFRVVIFYKYAAPMALKNSWLTTPQNALGSEPSNGRQIFRPLRV